MSELRHQEIIDRINYQYTDINGNVNFPNSFEGDVLKIAYKTAVAALKPELNPDQQKYLKQLQYNRERLGNTHDALFFGLVDYEKRWNFNDENFAQVIQIFSQWAQEQTN